MASRPHTRAAASAGSRPRISGEVLSRAAASGLAGLAGCGVVLALAWRSGGYFPDATLLAGCAAFAVLAVLLAVRPPAWTLSGPTLLALAGLGGLAAWTGLSATWSPMP